MPLYEYECKKCGQMFEVMQKFSDEPLKKHPKCGGKVDKLISRSGFQLKGTGWYVTDYAKSGSGAPAAEKAAEKGEKTETASESKTETAKSKSDAKADSSSSSSSSSDSKPAKAKKKK